MQKSDAMDKIVLPDNEVLTRKWLGILLAGIFLISFGMLAYEIIMTRILSVILSYHYVFAVISLALLGLGLGAVLDHLFWKRIPRFGKLGAIPFLSACLALSIPLSLLVIAGIAGSKGLNNDTFLYFLITAIPFCLSGLFFSELFRTFSVLSSRLYGLDLLGAAAGAVGAVIALNVFGGTLAISVIGSLVLASALLYTAVSLNKHMKKALMLTMGLIIILSLAGTGLASLPLAEVPVGTQDKEMTNILNSVSSPGRIVETRWNAFGRTDLVAVDKDPTQMVFFTDGTAGSSMYQFNGDYNNPGPAVQGLKTGFPGYLALSEIPPEAKNSALIIGPGGGRDVLLAQMAGVKQITAVEVNQATVDIVREYSQYNGGLYNAPNVSVTVDEGRNFLKRQNQKYDLILLSIPLTKTGRSVEAYALPENFLFTTDSIDDYLNHLTDGGRLIIVAHDQIETVKLLSLSLAALNQRGIDNESGMKQIAVIGNHMFPAFELKKTPFSSLETVSLHESIHEQGFDPSLSYLPAIRISSNVSHLNQTGYNQCSNFNELLVATSQGKVNFDQLSIQATASGVDIRPVTDNNPFFYKEGIGVPQPVPLVFWVSFIALVIVSWVFFTRRTKQGSSKEPRRRGSNYAPDLLKFIALFSLLGIGFMLVEISIFQRFILFLGQPVLSLAVMLASLLLGAGMGSLFSGRFLPERLNRAVIVIAPIIAAALVLYALAMPALLNQLLGLDLHWRLTVAAVMLIPLGFVMGFPFPSGMRLLKAKGLEDSVPWMWGINGIGSVVGSALTIVIAINYGFTAALILGAVCYLLILLVFCWKTETTLARKVASDLTQRGG